MPFCWSAKPSSERDVQSVVDSFLAATARLLLGMLRSESPVIPWTGLTKFDPVYAKVGQVHRQKQAAKSEEAFRGWKIVKFQRPILLSCCHRQVKIDKGIVVIKK